MLYLNLVESITRDKNMNDRHPSSKATIVKGNTMSELNIRSGYWFFFEVGQDQIAVFRSAYSIKEAVYFNDNPVSDRRRHGFDSKHEFHQKGKHFEIKINLISILRGAIECELYIDGQLHGKETKAFITDASPIEVLKNLTLFSAIGLLFGFLGAAIGFWFLLN